MRLFAGVAALPVAALALACNSDGVTGPREETFDWSGQIVQGNRIEIKGIIGGIIASATTGNEVVVSGVKRGTDSDPASVRIVVLTHAEGVTICALYPDVPGRPPNECLPGLAGSMSKDEDNDVEVTFTVSVPAGVDLRGQTVTGSLDAAGLQSDVEFLTVTGDVLVTTTEVAEATVVTGNIIASIGLLGFGDDLSFAAVTGNVSVTIPTATNADVQLSTVTGTVTSDFALNQTPGGLAGTLGSGGATLNLATVTGNVSLLSGS
jgi:hypothetical protein